MPQININNLLKSLQVFTWHLHTLNKQKTMPQSIKSCWHFLYLLKHNFNMDSNEMTQNEIGDLCIQYSDANICTQCTYKTVDNRLSIHMKCHECKQSILILSLVTCLMLWSCTKTITSTCDQYTLPPRFFKC